MILEYLKHLKRKWYIFLLAVLVIGGAAYFGQSYLYAKEKRRSRKIYRSRCLPSVKY